MLDFLIDKEYWTKVGKGLLIAIGGAFLTWVSTVFIPSLGESGNAILLALVPIFSALVNAAQKAYFG